MKTIGWNEEKNVILQHERGISFEDIIIAIDEDGLLDILEHPNADKYINQRIFVVAVGGYVYLVPFVETEDEIFLKTIIPSRKATKEYIIDNDRAL